MICEKCFTDKPATSFRPRSKYGKNGEFCNRSRSKVCNNCEYIIWKQNGRCPRCKNPVDGVCVGCALWRKKRTQEAKAVVFEHYGNKCEWCAQSIATFLTIDHKNGGGKIVRNAGVSRWRKIIKSGFPSDLRILCFNCNSGRAIYGDEAVLAAIAGLDLNRDLTNDQKRRIKEKEHVLNHYGRSCAFCNQQAFVFMTIDHIDGGGRQHRKIIGNNVYRWLIKENFPAGYRTLCWNCNSARAFCDDGVACSIAQK